MTTLIEQRHIERVTRSRNVSSIDNKYSSLIRSSWTRCIKKYDLHPANHHPICVLTDNEITERRDSIGKFLCIARQGMEDLYRHVASLNYVVLLTDMEGTAVDYIGYKKFETEFRRAGLYLGSIWKEPFAGTNAVGVCLSTAKPITCHRTDHFYAAHINLTCSAAPIFDPYGDLLAILDVSALRSMPAKESQYLALQLVMLFAKKIESANFLSHFAEHWIIRFGKTQEFVDVAADNLVAIDGNGIIIGATQAAAQTLYTDAKEMVDHTIINYFECTLDILFSSFSEKKRLRLNACNTNGVLDKFCVDVHKPRGKTIENSNTKYTVGQYATAFGSIASSLNNENYSPKLKLMMETLRSHKWNISEAANDLGIARSTIYRRMTKHGIVPPNKQ